MKILQKWLKIVSSGFNNILSPADNTIQKALTTLDQHTHSDLSDPMSVALKLHKLYYSVYNKSSYLYRDAVVAYDYIFAAGNVTDVYIYNSTASSHNIEIRKNGSIIYTINMTTSNRAKELHNLNLSYCTGDTLSLYCSGSYKPTNEIVVVYFREN
jgi:hypothetical protein